MKEVWEREEEVVAQRFKRGELPGFFRKQVLVKDNEVVIVEKEGEIFEELSPGEHTVSGLLDKDFTDVLFIDRSIKTMRGDVKGIWTKDDKKLDSDVEIKFKVLSGDKLSRNLVKSRGILYVDDVWNEIHNELLSKVLIPEIKERAIDDIYGKRDFLKQTEASLEVELKKTFELWGLELISFSLLWRFPEGYEKFLKERSSVKEQAEVDELKRKEELKEAEKEEEVKRLKGEETQSKEATLAELEKERLKREVEMELETEEAQKDVEEALEAMKLKDVKKGEKLLNGEEKSEGTREIEKLERKLKELKEAGNKAEEKFFKKELSEEAFKNIRENYEQRIIELESKIKTLKAGSSNA